MIMSTCNFFMSTCHAVFMFFVRMSNEDISMYMWYVNTRIAKAKLTKIYVTGQHTYFTYLLLII